MRARIYFVSILVDVAHFMPYSRAFIVCFLHVSGFRPVTPQHMCLAKFEASKPIQQIKLGRCAPRTARSLLKTTLPTIQHIDTYFKTSVPPTFEDRCRCVGSSVKRFWATTGRCWSTPTQFNFLDRSRRLEMSSQINLGVKRVETRSM